jgi:ribosome assembly protein SQT1
MQVFSSHTEATTAGYFTPNGKLLVTTSADSSACVFDPRENAPLLRLAPHQTYNFGRFEEGITSLAVAPASNFLAIGGAKGESIEGLAFMDILGLAGPGGDGSTKGLLLVSASTDGKAIVWDVTTSKPRAEVHHEVCRDLS